MYTLQANEEIVDWNATETRHCYYCVPIPGETAWVKQISFSLTKNDFT